MAASTASMWRRRLSLAVCSVISSQASARVTSVVAIDTFFPVVIPGVPGRRSISQPRKGVPIMQYQRGGGRDGAGIQELHRGLVGGGSGRRDVREPQSRE